MGVLLMARRARKDRQMLPSQAARGSRADRSLAEGKEDEDADDDSECKERTADAAKPSRKRKQSSKCKHIAAGKDLASRAKIDLPQPAPMLCMVGAPRPAAGCTQGIGHCRRVFAETSSRAMTTYFTCLPVFLVENVAGPSSADLACIGCVPEHVTFDTACNDGGNFVRETASGYSFVQKLESSRNHCNGLRRLAAAEGYPLCLFQPSVRGPGLLVGSEASPVAHIQQGIRAWMLQSRWDAKGHSG